MGPSDAIPARCPVMLSFDDGPRPGTTDRVLDVLAGLGSRRGTPLRAAFFTLATNPEGWLARRRLFAPYEIWTEKGSMERHPELVRRIVAERHWLGNHGATHFWPRWPWFGRRADVAGQLADWERAADVAAPAWREHGARIARAPYLVRTGAWQEATAEAGYRDVPGMTSGDADPRAGRDEVRQTLLERLARHARDHGDVDRAVVLIFHDIRELTAECLDDWIAAVQDAGHPLVDFDPTRL
ncbi:MAG: polysaccharide deacetylase family protein [Pseudomonadota bacterium]